MERTRELQLLRVDKLIHQVVKLGEGALKSREVVNLDKLLKFNDTLHKKNVSERQKKLAELESQIMEKGMQNEEMKKEILKIYKQHEEHLRVQKFLANTKNPSKRYEDLTVRVSTPSEQSWRHIIAVAHTSMTEYFLLYIYFF